MFGTKLPSGPELGVGWGIDRNRTGFQDFSHAWHPCYGLNPEVSGSRESYRECFVLSALGRTEVTCGWRIREEKNEDALLPKCASMCCAYEHNAS